ncbi:MULTISPECIES: 3-phosphoshikimate 1-carboxyvinyltransferase [Bacillaceae]|uniref:3-phosphoshikimate 1-carboxyvinyltransferase n=1 Tax=Bacillaceae TaxID=186817 RepID=UPI001E5FD027|nr:MULTISPECIES: 3-phosphoshikimate 1-carboxyvinyltransferase [Bacillaceae]MCE4047221.1 3-phosphoshikimate 1-carboxyvinyltransferase [Bacillus sp. Au-Bac7]MDL0435758.1 3-phosphoshikimate 1-carboxyvinyltransferase [Niallia sp. SS-2023]UPO86412.1 3-phosphoshikimate 1-carboxyvinyltransferase [Niallia sp. Man26]
MDQKQLKRAQGPLAGEIAIPGDKSISHRSVMFGSIAEGKTTVTNFLMGEDCLSTIACFKKLGVNIQHDNEKVIIESNGLAGLKEPNELLDVGNSGTTIRLMSGILAGRDFHSTLAGDSSIAKRPMTRVVNPLKEMGAKIDGRSNGEFTPLSIRGQKLKAISYKLPVASAQVKSSILFAGLQAEGTTTVVEPVSTRDHTERMIKAFGGDIRVDGQNIQVTGGQKLVAADIHVPGDISSAAFFLVAASIVPGSSVTLKNVGLNPTRTGIIDVLEKMGARVTIIDSKDEFEPSGDLQVEASSLKGTTVEGDIIPRLIDEIPIIALLATQAEGTTVIKDAEELKVKETNRIDTVVHELKKLGADIEATEDGMIIRGGATLKGAAVDSHGDHRIGMMLAVASLVTEGDIILENAEAISVSYPSFFEHMESLTV